MYAIGIRAQPLTPQDKRSVGDDEELVVGKIYESEFRPERSLNYDEQRQVAQAIMSQKYFEGLDVTYTGADTDSVVVQYSRPRTVRAIGPGMFALIVIMVVAAITAAVVSWLMIKVFPVANSVLENVNPFTLNVVTIGAGLLLIAGGIWLIGRMFRPEVEWVRGLPKRRREAARRKEYERFKY